MSDAASPQSVSTLQIGWIFLKIGMTAFGGLGATLAILHRELVESRRLLTSEQMTEALTFTKPLPGATAFQVVSYLGFRLGGWSGSATAAACFVLPPMLGMVLMAGLFGVLRRLPAFTSSLNGLTAVVAGLLFATAIRLGRANGKGTAPILIASTAFAAAVGFQVDGALIVLVGGLAGLAGLTPRGKPEGGKSGD